MGETKALRIYATTHEKLAALAEHDLRTLQAEMEFVVQEYIERHLASLAGTPVTHKGK